ncbi:MAG: helix-turn-helix domain-containing protein [Hyphomicrobium sp.]|jgi:DNA-binding CsgD family transcriptional regulator
MPIKSDREAIDQSAVGSGRKPLYHSGMHATVLELGADGKSRSQIARELGVSRKSLYEWIKNYPDFREAMEAANDLALAWWEDQGQKGVWSGRDFNAQCFSWQMKNRFPNDYKDKHEISGDPERPLVARIVRTIVDPGAGANGAVHGG